MGRLIDVDEYEKRIKPYDTEDVMDKALYNFAHDHLVTTPTAQPQPLIDQLRWERDIAVKQLHDLGYEFGEEVKDAQPETIRCKDCEWWTKQKDSLQGRCALMQMYPTGGWFCANARRKDR